MPTASLLEIELLKQTIANLEREHHQQVIELRKSLLCDSQAQRASLQRQLEQANLRCHFFQKDRDHVAQQYHEAMAESKQRNVELELCRSVFGACQCLAVALVLWMAAASKSIRACWACAQETCVCLSAAFCRGVGHAMRSCGACVSPLLPSWAPGATPRMEGAVSWTWGAPCSDALGWKSSCTAFDIGSKPMGLLARMPSLRRRSGGAMGITYGGMVFEDV